jgi:hypothetical protein
MSTHEARIKELSARVALIDSQVDDLNLQRHASAIEASGGDREAIKLIARIDTQIDQLLKERATVSSASDQIELLITAEAAAAEKTQQHELEVEAGKIASAVITLHEEIDQALGQLRDMLARRSALIADLGRTFTANPAYISRLAGKSGPTSAAQFVGLNRYVELTTVAAGSARPLSDANPPLLAISARAKEEIAS